MRQRTDCYLNMKLFLCCVTVLILECLIVLGGVQGETHPAGLLGGGGGFQQGPYNLEQQAQLFQNQYFPSGSPAADLQTNLFDFFRGGRFKLPQRRINFNKQDSLGYTFGHTQNAPQNFGFVSHPSNEGNFQQQQSVIPQTTATVSAVNKGPINLSSVASVGPTYAPFVTTKDRILSHQEVQPTQFPLSGIHDTSSHNPIAKSFSHPRFPFSSQGISSASSALFPNSQQHQQVVQNIPPASSGSPSGNSIPSFPPQNPNLSSASSQSPQHNPSSQFNHNLISNSGQLGINGNSQQVQQNPNQIFSTVSPYTLQPTQASSSSPPQNPYPQQNSLAVSYLTNNQQSINIPQPPVSNNNQGGGNVGISSNNNLALSSQTAQDAAISKLLATPTPVYQQVKELSGKSITYQFNPDSSITPIQISKGDIPTLEHPTTSNTNNNDKELVNLVNRVVGSTKVQTKSKGNIGISNPLVFPNSNPTNAPPAPPQQNSQGFQNFSPSPPTPFPQNNLQSPQFNSFPQNNPQQIQQQQQQQPFNNFPQGPPGLQGNFPPFGPQGPNNNGPPPPELENGYNPNHLQAFPEPPYESEFINDPLDSRDASELEAYLGNLRTQGRRVPDNSQNSNSNNVFPGDVGNPTAGGFSGLRAEEVIRIADGKPVPPQCAYNTVTQGTQGEECIGIKKK